MVELEDKAPVALVWVFSIGGLFIGVLGIMAVCRAKKLAEDAGWQLSLVTAATVGGLGAALNIGGLLFFFFDRLMGP